LSGEAQPNPNVLMCMATLGFAPDQVRGSPPTYAQRASMPNFIKIREQQLYVVVGRSADEAAQ